MAPKVKAAAKVKVAPKIKSAAPKSKQIDPSLGTAKPWPPTVPLGPIEDILPLLEKDDEDIDTLMLSPVLTSAESSTGSYGPEECEYICACLRNNSTLTHVNASCNAISDRGAAAFAALLSGAVGSGPPLTRLSLNSCQIGNIAATSLAHALVDNRKLQVLELSDNNIDDSGAVVLLDLLEKNKVLQRLTLALNPIDDELHQRIEKLLMIR